jgi:uncharacterized protein (TIGR02246 family)
MRQHRRGYGYNNPCKPINIGAVVQEAMMENSAAGEAAVLAPYRDLLATWNRRAAGEYTALFDDSIMNGRGEIEAELDRIFAKHITAAYVGKVRSMRFLGGDVAVLQAVAGLRPPGQSDISPAANSLHSLLTVRRPSGWRIALFQNTPAQFHDRRELGVALTEELRALL